MADGGSPMLSRPRKPPVKMFLPVGSLRFTHLHHRGETCLTSHPSPSPSPPPLLSLSPVEVEDELHEAALEEGQVPLPPWSSHLVDPPHSPGVHRWVHITELELVGCRRSVSGSELR